MIKLKMIPATKIKPAKSIIETKAPNIGAKNNWGKGRGGRRWELTRKRIFIRDKYTCQVCGVVTIDLECDHIVNLAAGGSDNDSNLQAICVPCHKIKTAKESKGGM